MDPAWHDPLKGVGRLLTSRWCRRVTLVFAAYQVWEYRPAGIFVAAAVVCFRSGLVYGLVSLIAEGTSPGRCSDAMTRSCSVARS
jgi:hypothetical protein